MRGMETFQFNRLRLIELQKKHGLPDTAFARKAGLTRQQYQQWKTGISRPNAASLAALANTFGVDINYFFTRNEQHLIFRKPLMEAAHG